MAPKNRNCPGVLEISTKKGNCRGSRFSEGGWKSLKHFATVLLWSSCQVSRHQAIGVALSPKYPTPRWANKGKPQIWSPPVLYLGRNFRDLRRGGFIFAARRYVWAKKVFCREIKKYPKLCAALCANIHKNTSNFQRNWIKNMQFSHLNFPCLIMQVDFLRQCWGGALYFGGLDILGVLFWIFIWHLCSTRKNWLLFVFWGFFISNSNFISFTCK